MKSFHNLGQACLLATLAVAGSAWAQTCSYEITTAAMPAPANVPSLSMLGVALLAAAVGFMAWRMGKFPGARFMAIALVAAAAMLANQGGGGLVQQAYAAVVEVVLSNPAGESASASANNGDTLTFRNTSGQPLRISSVTPATDACGEGTVLPVAGTCSTTVSCQLNCQPNEDQANGCRCVPGYARVGGICRPAALVCDSGMADPVTEQCVPVP